MSEDVGCILKHKDITADVENHPNPELSASNNALIIENTPFNEGPQLGITNENQISNLTWIFAQLHKAYDYHDKLHMCRFENIQLIRIRDKGLMKALDFKCTMCGLEQSISSEPDGDNHLNLNNAAIIGCQSIGIGFYPFQELFGALGIKCMSQATWNRYSTDTSEFIKKAAKNSMKEAAAKARQMAKERGDVAKGVPFTTVQVDGSYMKRSYVNSRYDSPAACVVIVEVYTRKVIQIITKQKTCAICDYAFSIGNENPRLHKCFRNHGRNDSSTSMESIAVAEAFANSIRETGLIYKVMLSDGDSSNYGAVLDSMPYVEYDIEVENILCVNHIYRNIGTNFKEVSKKRGLYGSTVRTKIEGSGHIVVNLIRLSVSNIKKLNCTWEQKLRLLRSDIAIIPYHAFGDHTFCIDNYFECEGAKDNEVNFVSQLEDLNLWNYILGCVARGENNVKSLLHNLTTNDAESFNALIAKCIGHKAYNYAKKDSYTSRCHVAVLQSNERETYAPVCMAMNKEITIVGQDIQLERIEKKLKRIQRKEKKDKEEEKIKKKYLAADKDYGLHAHQADANPQDYASWLKLITINLENGSFSEMQLKFVQENKVYAANGKLKDDGLLQLLTLVKFVKDSRPHQLQH